MVDKDHIPTAMGWTGIALLAVWFWFEFDVPSITMSIGWLDALWTVSILLIWGSIVIDIRN